MFDCNHKGLSKFQILSKTSVQVRFRNNADGDVKDM